MMNVPFSSVPFSSPGILPNAQLEIWAQWDASTMLKVGTVTTIVPINNIGIKINFGPLPK